MVTTNTIRMETICVYYDYDMKMMMIMLCNNVSTFVAHY